MTLFVMWGEDLWSRLTLTYPTVPLHCCLMKLINQIINLSPTVSNGITIFSLTALLDFKSFNKKETLSEKENAKLKE